MFRPLAKPIIAVLILSLVASGLTASPQKPSKPGLATATAETQSANQVCGSGAANPVGGPTEPVAHQVVVSPTDVAPRTVAHDGASVLVRPNAIRLPVGIGVTPLSKGRVPKLDTGMTNVTAGPRGGYQFTPSPMQFAAEVEVTLPYDPALIPPDFTAQDVYTYFYDEAAACWQPLYRLRVDEVNHTVTSMTDHFTDMINATVAAPEHAEGVHFNPNQIEGIKAADPASKINLLSPPGVSMRGDNRLTYPIELPGGRRGLEPQLSVAYSSTGGNGWMGVGWDVNPPMMMVDTRWGVPRYRADVETETYLLNGEQLTPVAHRGTPQARTAEKVFHTRVESGFARIVRHGSSPATYTWEVTDKSGTRWFYGASPGATGPAADSALADGSGNVYMWALREARDRHDNFMRYHYATVQDSGLDGGTEPGRNLYLERITYTGSDTAEGRYAVSFTRDRELGEQLRVDKTIDARGGFKRVTADLLRRVDVTIDATLIRRYEFAYTTGAFSKTLLKSVSQFDDRGAFFNKHEFDYFDDIRDGQGQYQAFDPAQWTVPGDSLTKSVLNLTPEQAGNASALNASSSTGVGGHVYVGVGPFRSKSNSIGVKTGFSNDRHDGVLALVDIDGDSLPDKVFRRNGAALYRKNLSGPAGQLRFDDVARPLNVPGFFGESTNTVTFGVESYLGGIAAQLDFVNAFTTTDQYLTDVNSDGITDLVSGSTVLFGRVGTDGVPAYGVSGDTPVPITAGQLNPDGLFGSFAADRERLIDSIPLLDTVRRWEAPFSGTVRIEGGVTLAAETATARAASRTADGVRVAIQREGTELWSDTIGPRDNTEHIPANVASIAVSRGDRLYFRVQSVADGGLDQVSWDPRITYLNVPDPLDANGLPFHRYQASRDFTLGGRKGELTVPLTGILHMDGELRKPVATTDDVTIILSLNGIPVVERTIAAAATGTIPMNIDASVQKGQTLSWRVRIDSPIDLNRIEWAPRAFYTSAQGVDRVTDDFGRPLIEIFLPYSVDMYPVNDLVGPQQFHRVTTTGTVTVTPILLFAFDGEQPNGRIVFTVKRRGQLLAKRNIEIVNGGAEGAEAFTVPVNAGDDLFFDFSTADPRLRDLIVGHSASVNGTFAGSSFNTPAEEGAFPQPYRGWAAIGYNGNRGRATQPINQADLVIDENAAGQFPTTLDPQAQRDAFAADPRIDPPKAVPFIPSPQFDRWGAGDRSWVSRTKVSSSRMGAESVHLPSPQDLAGSVAVPRMSRAQQISLTGNVGIPVGTVGGSIAFGDSSGQLDYLDLNGDQFPDVVGGDAVQYTDPTGGLGATRGTLPDGAVRRSGNISGNAGAGSAARTISTGRGDASPPGDKTASPGEAGNDLPPLGIGGNLGASSSEGEFDLMDVNGDELPDRIYANGRVALNLGYRFGSAEQWRNPAPLNDGNGLNGGLNIGFNTDFYGFAGGASFSQGRAASSATLADMNGDGLPDRVFAGSPIQVAFNTGNGFEPAVPYRGSLSEINLDRNASFGGGAYFTFSFCFAVVVACVIVNPGGDFSTGAARTEQALRDINGDGYADHMSSTRDNQLVVAQNRTGRTNLLRGVSRPLGARMEFDYRRDGNTFGLPQSRWVLTRVSVDDGRPGDGQDVQLTTFDYAGGRYDRLEREFYGYATVTEQHRDPGDDDSVYRTITREFRTDSFYTRGLPSRQVTADGAGRTFLEMLNTYAGRDIDAPSAAADLASTTATIFPQLVRTEQRFYEGQATPSKSTFTTTEYDEFGNATRSVDTADAGAADDVDSRIGYTATDPECRANHIVGVPNRISVFAGGPLARDRESTVDCANGNVTQVRAMLADGTPSIVDLEYFPSGNLKSFTEPPNKAGQRHRLAYTYDTTVDTYIESTTDSFGYVSRSTYNFKFGQEESTTDINNQVIRNTFDSVGRVDHVVGPYEAPEGRITVDFEYHPEAAYPFAVTRHVDRDTAATVRADTIDTITFVDGLGRMTQTKEDSTVHTGPDIAPANVMVVSGRQVYDFVGRAVKESYPVTEPKNAANTTFNPAFDPVQPTTTTHDILDRTTSTVLPDNTASTMSYGFGPDRAGVTQFETVMTDANGKVKRSYSDVRDLTTAIKEFNPAGGQPVIWTSYTFDALKQQTAVTDDRNNVTSATYDNFGRRASVTNPDSGRTVTEYDLAGNIIRKVTAKLAAEQKAIEFDYDFDRVRAVRYPIFPANNVTYTYGAVGAPDNTADRITSIVDGAGTVTRKYGPLGEVTQETRTVSVQGGQSRTFTTGYQFDTFSRVLRMTFPDGEALSYRYDSGGQVDRATGSKGTFSYTYMQRLDYDKFGERVLMDTGNGTRTQYTFDPLDRRLNAMKANLSEGYVFQNLNYTYDDVGNILSVRNVTEPPSGPDVGMQVGGPSTQNFRYDDLHRLVHAEGTYQSRNPGLDTYRQDVAYDTVHNLTSKTQVREIVKGGNTQQDGKLSYAYGYAYAGSKPHAPTTIGPFTIAYDANGNQISRDQQPRPRRQMIWDEENRLACSHENVQSQTLPQTPASCDNAGGTPNAARYRYDADGVRVVKDSAQFHLYPNQHYSTRGNHEFKHVYIGETKLLTKFVEPVNRVEDRKYYSHPDHLGSTGFVTDESGGLSEHLKYFPGGETWVSEHPSQPVPHQFTGKEFDPETGLYYFGARYYDPRTQVWQSPDPALPDAARNPTDLSAYLYGAGNPLTFIDPDGRQVRKAKEPDPEVLGDELMNPELGPLPDPGPASLPIPQSMMHFKAMQIMGASEGAAQASVAVATGVRSPIPGFGARDPRIGLVIGGTGLLGSLAVYMIASKVATITRVTPAPRTRMKNLPIYVVYEKYNAKTGKTYVGRSSGYGTPAQVVAARDRKHHMWKKGFGTAKLYDWRPATLPHGQRWADPYYQAIRGLEQMLIDSYGGSIGEARLKGKKTKSGNAIRGVSPWNKLGYLYWTQGVKEFGPIAPYTGR
ncbi:MAG TPA: SpvB/TcaC N-terminal domain-containing protein [Candidatus Limnocylindrales bacterium]